LFFFCSHLIYLYDLFPRSASSFLIPLFRSEFVMGDFDRNLSWAAVLGSIVHRDSFLAPLPKTSQRLHGGDGRRQSVPRNHASCAALLSAPSVPAGGHPMAPCEQPRFFTDPISVKLRPRHAQIGTMGIGQPVEADGR
jgi:hypothetical protein